MGCSSDRLLVTKQDFAPDEEDVFEQFLEQYREALQPVEDGIDAWLEQASEEDLNSLANIRPEVRERVEEQHPEFENVFRDNGRDGARAGRATAARQHSLDVNFEVVPRRTLDELDEWVTVAAGSTLDTITEDASKWLRGAHKEGLSIDEISTQINELYEGQLEDHVARRAARTGTVATSNAGAHSAIEDSAAIAKQWVTNVDGREREDHADADGQVVGVDQSFEVGGIKMAHPGDPSAPIEQIANCRCAVVPLFEDDLSPEQVEEVESGNRIWL